MLTNELWLALDTLQYQYKNYLGKGHPAIRLPTVDETLGHIEFMQVQLIGHDRKGEIDIHPEVHAILMEIMEYCRKTANIFEGHSEVRIYPKEIEAEFVRAVGAIPRKLKLFLSRIRRLLIKLLGAKDIDENYLEMVVQIENHLEMVKPDIISEVSTDEVEYGKTQAELEQILKGAKVDSDEIKRLHSELSDARNQLDRHAGLVKTVESFADSIKKTHAEQDRLQEQLTEKLGVADGLVTKGSDKALSKAFEDKRDQLNQELEKLDRYFLWSLLAVVAALGVALFGIPALDTKTSEIYTEILKHFMTQEDGGAYVIYTFILQFIGQSVTKGLTLIPPVWFAISIARRRAMIFKLREHYAYKQTMAMSVYGFGNHAASYSDEVALGILNELSHNPADQLLVNDKANDEKPPIFFADLITSVLEKASKFKDKGDTKSKTEKKKDSDPKDMTKVVGEPTPSNDDADNVQEKKEGGQ